jgi:hypothetical protein
VGTMPSWPTLRPEICSGPRKRWVQSPPDPGSVSSMGMGSEVKAIRVAEVIAVCLVPQVVPFGHWKAVNETSWA